MTMRVLITGCSGFIGSNLVERCLKEGWHVDGVDDESNGRIEFLPQSWLTDVFDNGMCYHRCDFTSRTVIEDIRSQKYDTVFHLAAIPRVSYSVEHPLETHETNVTKTLKLIDECKGNVKRFVFASSSSVYGGADVLPTQESRRKDPKSPYALQKSFVEDYLQLYCDLYGFDSTSLRFFNVFGPNCLGSSPYATAVSAWLTAIKQGKPLRSDGDGEQSRDMCYVVNVTDACVKAAVSLTSHSRFNVACGESVTNNEVLAYLMKRYPGTRVVNAPERPGDVKHTLADVSRAKKELGYEPIVRVWEGIKRTCDWYDANWKRVKNMGLRT